MHAISIVPGHRDQARLARSLNGSLTASILSARRGEFARRGARNKSTRGVGRVHHGISRQGRRINVSCLSCPRYVVGAHFLNPDHAEALAAVRSRRGD